MKHALIAIACVAVLAGCSNAGAGSRAATDTGHVYPAVSYLHIRLGPHGQLPANPYILVFERGRKKIVFCGTNHLTDAADTDNPMYKEIEKAFFALMPDVAINEGGDISGKKYPSKKDAIFKDGEIGLTKILCDSLKINTVNGDPAAAAEFGALLRTFSKGELLAYIVTERLIWGLKGEQITDTVELEHRYDQFIRDYIMGQGGVRLTAAEQSFAFYKDNYAQLLQRPFSLTQLEPTNPFVAEGKFQKIGRTSKEIRDQFLMQTIDRLLDTHDKVFVVFGGWHLLTCQPGLQEIINKKRE